MQRLSMLPLRCHRTLQAKQILDSESYEHGYQAGNYKLQKFMKIDRSMKSIA